MQAQAVTKRAINLLRTRIWRTTGLKSHVFSAKSPECSSAAALDSYKYGSVTVFSHDGRARAKANHKMLAMGTASERAILPVARFKAMEATTP